jgi:uncharacterized protein
MRYVAIFHDAVDPSRQERELNERHFAYLKSQSDRIVIAGGLRDDFDAPFCGALWIIEATRRAEAIELVERDPYSLAGLWPNYSVFAWGKAPLYGAVTL